MKRIPTILIAISILLGIILFAGIVTHHKSNPVEAKGKPRFSGLIIAYPDGGYVGVPDASGFVTLKDRVKDKAILRKFECWTSSDGKTFYDEYNNTEDWTYCKVKTIER